MNIIIANLKHLYFEVGVPLHELCELANVSEAFLFETLTQES